MTYTEDRQPLRLMGRPRSDGERMQSRSLTMTDADYDRLAAWGGGNASEGLRRIIAAAGAPTVKPGGVE